MERNIGIYSHTLELQNHEYAKLYHKATLGVKEDEKYDLSKEKIENFYMELCLVGQTFYRGKVVTTPPQTIQATGQLVFCIPVLNTAVKHRLCNRLSLTTEQVKIGPIATGPYQTIIYMPIKSAFVP